MFTYFLNLSRPGNLLSRFFEREEMILRREGAGDVFADLRDPVLLDWSWSSYKSALSDPSAMLDLSASLDRLAVLDLSASLDRLAVLDLSASSERCGL